MVEFNNKIFGFLFGKNKKPVQEDEVLIDNEEQLEENLENGDSFVDDEG